MHKSDNRSFEISNTKIANELIMLDVIKNETVRVKSTDTEDCCGSYLEPTGKYIITPEGKLYRDSASNAKKSKFWTELRAWITLAIAIPGLVLSIISLVINVLISNYNSLTKTKNRHRFQ